MPKELERDLGLPAVLAISVGAMVGSGIFILPALAMEMAGSAVVLAYLLAGLLVLPAALSKSEMATAMPEAGGTYVYIERSMGPLLGTIAGVGTWFALSFKGALALVGGAPYVVLLLDVPVEPLALGLAVLLVVVNLVGVKQTGRLQIAIVVVMLAAMAWFAAGSLGAVDAVRFEGLFAEGTGGLLAATGFVFVSYAGVTKVASVAEEVENPSRNIPLGMLGSLAFTTGLYVLVVAVLVGAAPTPNLAGSNTPVADVARATLARPGLLAVVLAAVLALISTANAGLLSSSRYPFAMSRDELVPRVFEYVSPRFNTPTVAISLTGVVLLVMIAFVPIDDIAKLGSAFQILVFVLINVAVVAFRESTTAEYDPDFRDPLYPWTQAVGVVGGLVLLTQMGALPMAGAVVICGVGAAWYLGYARPRVRREGVARDELRRRVGQRAVEETRAAVDESVEDHVVVGITEDTSLASEETLVRIAADVARSREGRVTAIRFDEVPDQLPLEPAAAVQSPGDTDFERRVDALADDLGVPVEYGEIVSHDVRHAMVNYADHHGADLLVLEDVEDRMRSIVFAEDDEWIASHAPCDVLLVDADRIEDAPSEVALVTDSGPFDPIKVGVADAVASAAGASIVLVQALASDGTDRRRERLEEYHDQLVDLCSVPVESRIVEADDGDALAASAGRADLVVLEGDATGVARVFDRHRLEELVDGPAVVLWPHGERAAGPFDRLLERLAF